MSLEYAKDNFLISTDLSRFDALAVLDLLQETYWGKGVTRDQVERYLRYSLCYGIYHGDRQIGFARAVTDYTSLAYLSDIVIHAQYRGQGMAKWLMQCILSHPELQQLRRWVLLTRDAHKLYEQFGFTPLKEPERYMELVPPNNVKW